MNDFFGEFFSKLSLLSFGVSLLIIGPMFWAFPFTCKRVLAARRTYAANLRAAGDETKADQIEAETTALVRRGERNGRLLVAVGAAVVVVSLFRK